MCVVSMIGDHYGDKWRPIINPPIAPAQMWPTPPHAVTREEFDALKRDVEEMKALLIKAKAYDEAHGEPECELDEKMAVLRKMAELVGIDLDDVLPAHNDGVQA